MIDEDEIHWCKVCREKLSEQSLCGIPEAFQSDARAMECAEAVDPFFAPDRALNRGYL